MNVKTELEEVVNRVVDKHLSQFVDTSKPEYQVGAHLSNGYPTLNTLRSIISTGLNEIYATGRREVQLPYTVAAMEMLEEVFNDVDDTLQKYHVYVPLHDMLEIGFHKDILEARQKLKDEPTVENITHLYSVFDGILESVEEKGNSISLLSKTKTINDTQAKQGFAGRGFVADIDSTVFATPIASSYLSGLGNMYEIAVDSRSATIALHQSTTAIQTSEDFSKTQQLVGMAITGFECDDCGTTRSMPHVIEGPTKDYAGDLERMWGIYYKENPNDVEWKLLQRTDTHLIGKEIYVRNVFTCDVKHRRKLCRKCYGTLSDRVLNWYNLGYWSKIQFTEKKNQGYLSTKHRIASAEDSSLDMDEITKKYFVATDDKLKFAPGVPLNGTKLIIPIDEFKGIVELKDRNKLSDIYIDRISTITRGYLKIGNVTEPLTLKFISRESIASIDLLEYIIKQGYEVNEYDYVIIDMSKWKPSKPVFMVPKKSFDFNSYGMQLRKIISDRTRGKNGERTDTPDAMLKTLLRFVNTKLAVHYAPLTMVVYAMSAEDPDNFDFRPSKDPSKKLPKQSTILSSRSLSQLMNKGTTQYLHRIHFRLDVPAISHPLDVILSPVEVVEEEHAERGLPLY